MCLLPASQILEVITNFRGYIASATKLVQRAAIPSGGQHASLSHLAQPIGTEAPPLVVLSKVQQLKSRHHTGTADVLHSVFVGLKWEVWGQDLDQLYLVEI